MLQKIFHFIKYNNATVIILAIILILGGGALAAGSENIGEKQTSVEGIDNTALLAADFDVFNMDFKIENIEQDEKYYYAAYSYLDLVVLDNAWQYQLNSKTQKISKKIKPDIGEYLVKFLTKHYEARIRELKQEKNQAESAGGQTRIEVTEYSGLIGRTLDLAAKVFPGYEPAVKRELPAPEFSLPTLLLGEGERGLNSSSTGQVDSLTQIYNDYVDAHPEIFTESATSTPVDTASSTSADLTNSQPADSVSAAPSDNTATPEQPVIIEPKSVDIIELPALPAGESASLSVPAESAPAE